MDAAELRELTQSQASASKRSQVRARWSGGRERVPRAALSSVPRRVGGTARQTAAAQAIAALSGVSCGAHCRPSSQGRAVLPSHQD